MSSAIGVIQGFHAVVAMTRDEPHWLINDADAKRYGVALANAARHFPVKATQKALDVGVLIFCAVQIETPRIVMSSKLMKQPAHRRPQPMGQVFQFIHPNAPASPATSPGPSPGASPAGEGAGAQPPIADAPPDYSAGDGAIGGEPAA